MPTIAKQAWGTAPAGPVEKFTLENDKGNTIDILTLGGTIQSLKIAGSEMVLGFDELEGYLGEQPYYGALIGRYGNRIANARFTLNGQTYELDANERGNQLHGGSVGFDKKIWEAEPTTTDDSASLQLRLTSLEGDMGYPGTLSVTVTYTWTNDDSLRIDYHAVTDRDTVVNLTNHAYFHIGGSYGVLDQLLTLDADRYVPVDDEGIPLGDLREVEGNPFDFRTAKRIGQDIKAAGGYDHTYEINGYDGTLREFAVLRDPTSGRELRCATTEPGCQVFTTNFSEGQFKVRGNAPITPHCAICLETQHFPDSPNQENFETPLLKVGETYNTTTVYRFLE